MSEWIERRLADVCASIDYGLTASAKSAPPGPKFLRITDIVGGALRWETVPYVAGTIAALERYRLHDDDIVIARTGATTGESYFIQNPPEAVFASYLVRLKIKKEFDPRYVAYWLKSLAFRDFLHGVMGDKSAQPNASASTMTNAKMKLPADRSYQTTIASILGSLDDKIDLNRRMNETLEEMARAMFKDWFVDFGPTRAKMEGRAPYLAPELWALFPDRLDDEGNRPLGWHRKTLFELCELKRGYDLPTAQRRSGPVPIISSSGISGYHDASMAEGPGVVTGRYGTIGEVFFIDSSYWPLNTALYVKDFKGNNRRFVFYMLSQIDFRAYSDKGAVPGVNRNHLHQALIFLPAGRIQEAFADLLTPIWRRSAVNRCESESLATTRDLLLPKLMSGEIRVQDAERVTEPAA